MLTTKSQPALKIPAYRKEEAGECKIRLCRPPFSSLLQFGQAAIIGMVQSRDIISFNCIVGKMVASTDNITIKGLQGIIAFDTGFYQPFRNEIQLAFLAIFALFFNFESSLDSRV